MIANLSPIETQSTEVLDAPLDFSAFSEKVLIGGVFCAQ
jgi:hypothetical protein